MYVGTKVYIKLHKKVDPALFGYLCFKFIGYFIDISQLAKNKAPLKNITQKYIFFVISLL